MADREKLNTMLGEVLAQVPAPTGRRDWQASYLRNRKIQQLLAEKALVAAEEKWPDFARRLCRTTKPRAMAHIAMLAADARWPGFAELFDELMHKETEFMGRAGPQA